MDKNCQSFMTHYVYLNKTMVTGNIQCKRTVKKCAIDMMAR